MGGRERETEVGRDEGGAEGWQAVSPFDLCTETVLLKDGTMLIGCKRGNWRVEGMNHEEVKREAANYFRQYLADGEYDDILKRSRQASASRASPHAKNFLRDNPQ